MMVLPKSCVLQGTHVLPDCSSMPIVVADSCALCVAGITKEYQEWAMEREESSAES